MANVNFNREGLFMVLGCVLKETDMPMIAIEKCVNELIYKKDIISWKT